MESLMFEDSGLGLNIVCEEKPKNVAISAKKRPRKQNKYERRRAKARRAKELLQGESTAIVNDVGQEVATEHDEPMKVVDKSVKEEENRDLVDQESTTVDVPQLEVKPPAHSPSEDSPAMATRNAPPESSTPRSVSPPTTRPVKASRKVHVDPLQDTEQRAQYMAEFHARPMEMDRRGGAISMHRIVPSKDSKHIFDEHAPFASLGLHERLVSALMSPKFGLAQPTVIQTRAIHTLQKHDRCNLIVQSETGSGKTLAYLLPIVQSLAVGPASSELRQHDRHAGGTRCVILCPTRELASQTALVATKVCQQSFSWLVAGCLSGGEKRKSEKARIRKGISILVATPGRLLDHLSKTESLLMALKGKLEWLVLDEADRLLDMGLGVQVEQIVQHLRANQPKSGPNRDGVTWRSILVSATVTNKVEDLAKKMLGGDTWQRVNGVSAVAGVRGGALAGGNKPSPQDERKGSNDDGDLADSTPRQLGQFHVTVTAKLRLPTLIAFLVQRIEKSERTVIFMSTCDGVDYHHALFSAMDSILPADDGNDAAARGLFGASCQLHKLHGNVPHAERVSILEKFNRGGSQRASILLATDVAARGLNLASVDWTVQYDPPCEVADYAHRAGRAARAGKAGHSLLFLLPSERQFLDVLKLKGVDSLTALSLTSTLNQAADVCVDFTKDGEKHAGGGYGQSKAGRTGEAFAFEIQRRLEDCVVEEDAKARTAAKKANLASRPKKGGKRTKKEETVGHLLDLARRAYRSYIRSYPTKEKSVKHIFSARALHLGHMARSFALKEPPTTLSTKSRGNTDAESTNKDRKREASLAFHVRTDEEIAASIIPKRLKPSSDLVAVDKSDRSMDSKKARTLLLARAASLEQVGMDGF